MTKKITIIKAFIFLVFLFALVGLTPTAFAATDFYITQNASGGDTGADCSNAHSMVWLNSASNWGAGASQIGAGKTVHLCGVLTSPITIQGGGTSGNPITIFFENNAKISMPYFTASYNSAIFNSAYSYIVIDGGTNGIIETTDNGTAKTYQVDCTGIMSASKVDGWEVKNMHIGPMYERTPNSSDCHEFGSGINFKFGGSNIKIHDNVVDKNKGGIASASGMNDSWSNLEIYNNTITHTSSGINIGQSGSTGNTASISNISIHDNIINGGDGFWDGSWPLSGCGCAEGCNDGHNHVGGIFCWGSDNTASFTGLSIYRNQIGPTMSATGLSASIFLQYHITNAQVYNNVVTVSDGNAATQGFIAVLGQTEAPFASNAKIYNNTVYNSGYGGSGIYTSTQGADIQNNLLYNVDTGINMGDANTTIATCDHNLYFPSVNFRYKGVTGDSWTQWRAHSENYDVHSFSNINPLLSAGYIPLLGSPVIGVGANLTSAGIANLNSDKVGVARPGGSTAWDIGAYQYAGADITPPTISAIATSTTASTATIIWTTDESATSSVKYGTSLPYTFASSSNIYVPSLLSHSITLHGLSPGTQYHFQIGSTDASGNRATSSDYTFTTASGSAGTGNINAAYHSAWMQNAGWLDFGQGNVIVSDSALTGYAWGENIGWINLNPALGGVHNDINGNLSGAAWGENVGWIYFGALFGGGASIDSSGDFHGYAWGENIGWISLNCANTNSCGTINYKVNTTWRPAAITPLIITSIATSTTQTAATITWTTNVNATSSVKYGLSSSYNLASSSNPLVTSHTINLKSLTANTTYHFRVESTNGSGVLASSSDHTFHTTALATYTIGGSISGLTGGTVVLRNNGKDDLSRSANGSFNFVTATTTGATYNVTIYTQPTGQTCSITGGSGFGTVAGANVTTVAISCAANSYTFTAVPSLGTLTCNGGSCASSYNYGTSLAMSATSVAGYTVALSSTGTANGCSSSGGGAGAPVTCTAVIPAGNTGITATYSPISYTYTFDGNSATTPPSPTSVTQNYGTSISTPTAPARTGYTFSSWSPSIPATMPVSGGTSVAQWSVNSYTVTFNGNGSDGGSTAAQSLVYNTPTALTANGFTRTGYLFAGWNTLANGTGTNYTNGASYTIGAAAITLYAQWTTSSYTVTFDKNGGNTDANPITKTAAYNNNVGTLPTAPTKTGSTFASWNTAANGSGTAFTAVTAVTADLTVYAQWTANTYTIGGTITGLTGTVVLQNNGKNNLSIASTSNSFVFSTATTTGNPYLVTVQTQPTGQTCSVNSGSGTVSSANVTTVSVTCTDNTCASLSNALSYNAYPTCGAATCVSGYNLSGSGSGATCVAQSSGGGGGGGGSTIIAPNAPTNFSAITSARVINLSWTNPTSNFTGVKLYRKINSALTGQTDTAAQLIYQGSVQNFTDASTTVGTLYYYSLYSYNSYAYYSQPNNIFIYLSAVQTISTSSIPIITPTGNSSSTPADNNSGASVITTLIGATSATVNQVTASEASQLIASPTFAPFTAAEKIIYAKITALSSAILSDVKKYIIADFIHFGTPTTITLGAGERGGSIASFQSAFARLPNSNLDWQDVVKIGNGRWTTQISPAAEARAKISFQKIYLREPSMKQANDNAAVNIMAYGLRPAQRNTASEKIAILSFKYIFKKTPVSAQDWDEVRAISYSGAKR